MRRTDQGRDTLQADGDLPQRALQVAWRLFDRADDGSRQGAIQSQRQEGRKAEEEARSRTGLIEGGNRCRAARQMAAKNRAAQMQRATLSMNRSSACSSEILARIDHTWREICRRCTAQC